MGWRGSTYTYSYEPCVTMLGLGYEPRLITPSAGEQVTITNQGRGNLYVSTTPTGSPDNTLTAGQSVVLTSPKHIRAVGNVQIIQDRRLS